MVLSQVSAIVHKYLEAMEGLTDSILQINTCWVSRYCASLGIV